MADNIAHVTKSDVRWFVQDPIQPTKSVQTSRGELAFGKDTECMVIKDPSLAAEIKEKKPWMLVSPFENPAFRSPEARTRKVFVMPELPYLREKEREHRDDTRGEADLQQSLPQSLQSDIPKEESGTSS